MGWVDQCRAWLQNRRGAGLLQPYRVMRKLFRKDALMAHEASALFRAAPYVQFGAMAVAAAIIPVIAMRPALGSSADTIALVGLFALVRVFSALAAMDCWRSSKIDHLCSLKTDQGWRPRDGSLGMLGV
ncbi:MAG: NADH-quinone oxidoreductase subunit H [Xanthomonadales bacterium]|nr:NADH-quinone oxidoreductase subunit H [Xanthomonadales bacterium]